MCGLRKSNPLLVLVSRAILEYRGRDAHSFTFCLWLLLAELSTDWDYLSNIFTICPPRLQNKQKNLSTLVYANRHRGGRNHQISGYMSCGCGFVDLLQ